MVLDVTTYYLDPHSARPWTGEPVMTTQPTVAAVWRDKNGGRGTDRRRPPPPRQVCSLPCRARGPGDRRAACPVSAAAGVRPLQRRGAAPGPRRGARAGSRPRNLSGPTPICGDTPPHPRPCGRRRFQGSNRHQPRLLPRSPRAPRGVIIKPHAPRPFPCRAHRRPCPGRDWMRQHPAESPARGCGGHAPGGSPPIPGASSAPPVRPRDRFRTSPPPRSPCP